MVQNIPQPASDNDYQAIYSQVRPLEFSNFESEWLRMERDRHCQILTQLKRELAQMRRGSDRPYRLVEKVGRR